MNELLHLSEMKNAATLLHKSAEFVLAPTNAYCVAHPKHRNTVLIDAFGHSHCTCTHQPYSTKIVRPIQTI